MNVSAGLHQPDHPLGHEFELPGWVNGVSDVEEISASIGDRQVRTIAAPEHDAPSGTIGFLVRTDAPIPTGWHEVAIRNASGKILTSTIIRVGHREEDEPLCLYEIDDPPSEEHIHGDVLAVRGWVMLASQAPSVVEVVVDGCVPVRARTRLPRPDVVKHMPGFPEASLSGFEARVPIPIPRGTSRSLSVRIRASSHLVGEWVSSPRTVVLSNPPARREDTQRAAALWERSRQALARTRPRSDPRHMLVFTHSLALGGGQLWLQELMNQLVDTHGWRVTVVTQLDGDLRSECEARGIEVHLTSPFRVGDTASYEGHVAELAHLAHSSEASVALVNTLGAFTAADAAIRAGLPTAWVLHESFGLADFAYQNWGAAGVPPAVHERWVRALGAADRLLFVAEATRELFVPYSQPSKCRVIRYGTPMARFRGRVSTTDRRLARRKLGIADDTTLLLNVGVLEPRKGQGLLLSAMDWLRKIRPEVRLSILGHHESAFGQAMADTTTESNMGEWVDLVPVQQDPTPWFQAADIFVNSSDVESLPRSILEAVCCGLPVVATDVFGAREMIRDGHTGWLCEPNDAEALTVGMLRALESTPEQRESVASAAYESLRDWLDPAGYAAAYVEMLTELVKEWP